jgi:hypothetical protein
VLFPPCCPVVPSSSIPITGCSARRCPPDLHYRYPLGPPPLGQALPWRSLAENLPEGFSGSPKHPACRPQCCVPRCLC